MLDSPNFDLIYVLLAISVRDILVHRLNYLSIGFLGKSMTRHFNRLWNYVLKGALGSVITVLVMPVACLVTSSLSVLAAVLSPLWCVENLLFYRMFDESPMKMRMIFITKLLRRCKSSTL